jgi:hypothetical protein
MTTAATTSHSAITGNTSFHQPYVHAGPQGLSTPARR